MCCWIATCFTPRIRSKAFDWARWRLWHAQHTPTFQEATTCLVRQVLHLPNRMRPPPQPPPPPLPPPPPPPQAPTGAADRAIRASFPERGPTRQVPPTTAQHTLVIMRPATVAAARLAQEPDVHVDVGVPAATAVSRRGLPAGHTVQPSKAPQTSTHIQETGLPILPSPNMAPP